MAIQQTRTHQGPRAPTLTRALGVATAALLAVDAYVHFNNAGQYDIGTGSAITQGSLFRIQASVAAAVAIALLIRPQRLIWAAAVVVTASATAAVLLYTYVDVGQVGPLPNMYEPTWSLPGKRASAAAETVATVLSIVGLGVALWTRRTERHRAGGTREQGPSVLEQCVSDHPDRVVDDGRVR